jgi:hypothetical protein
LVAEEIEGQSYFGFLANVFRAERCGLRAKSVSASELVGFFLERFLFGLPGEAFFTPTGKLLSASGGKIAAPAL